MSVIDNLLEALGKTDQQIQTSDNHKENPKDSGKDAWYSDEFKTFAGEKAEEKS